MNIQPSTVTLNIQDYNFLKEQSDKCYNLSKYVEENLLTKNVIWVERTSYGSIKNLKLQEGDEPILEIGDVKTYVDKLNNRVEYLSEQYSKENKDKLEAERMLKELRDDNREMFEHNGCLEHKLDIKKREFWRVVDYFIKMNFWSRLIFTLDPESTINNMNRNVI